MGACYGLAGLAIFITVLIFNLLGDTVRDLLNPKQKRRSIKEDLALVEHLCDTVAVMHKGELVETGKADEVIRNPKQEYTKLLLASVFPVGPTEEWAVPEYPR